MIGDRKIESSICPDENGLYTMSQSARIINNPFAGRTIIYRLLREHGIIDNYNQLTREFQRHESNKGLFEVKGSLGYNPRQNFLFRTIRVTSKGLYFLKQFVEENAPIQIIGD
jgi:phage antirepressor YoqD-like protein